MSNQATPYPLRMPEELRELLAERSRGTGRSLHAEILMILQQAVENSPSTAAIDIDALAEALAPKLAARLKDTP